MLYKKSLYETFYYVLKQAYNLKRGTAAAKNIANNTKMINDYVYINKWYVKLKKDPPIPDFTYISYLR